MTNEQLAASLTLAQEVGGARFTNIGDISCDPEVQITPSPKSSHPDARFTGWS